MNNTSSNEDYLVTAIVSTYASERFMRACLDDLLAQSVGNKLEIIVIDSGSPEDEGNIVREFQKNHSNIVYLRTERERLYQAWNRAIRMARGRYLTSANTDDRHRYDAFEKWTEILDNNREAILVYGDQKISHIENETFEQCEDGKTLKQPPFSREILLEQCFPGSQPMWRASAHKTVGYFSEDLTIAGDYDMWLKMSAHWDFIKTDDILGQYLYAEQGLEHKNQYICDIESFELRNKYINILNFKDRRAVKKKIAGLSFAKGYRYILGNEPKRAKKLLLNAILLSPLNLLFYKTYFLRIIFGYNRDIV